MNPVAYVAGALVETLAIACASFALAVLLAIPWAAAILRGGYTGRACAVAGTAIRAIPELVLAIVAVVALGLGFMPAIVALAIHYAAVLAKMFADTIGAVRREPAEALRATGATALTAFAVGAIPLAWSGITGFAAYAFESIVRAAVIVGVVGAGGIGSLLLQQLNLADYTGFAWSVAALAILVAGVEFGADRLRRAPPQAALWAYLAIAAIGIVAIVFAPDPPWRMIASIPQHLGRYVREAVPQWNPEIARAALLGLAQSALVALVGTAAGTVLAIPFALLSAHPIVRGWMRGTGLRPGSIVPEYASRVALVALRAVPPVALALVAISFVGLGPAAGAVALVLHTTGVLGKLLAESLELAEREPAESLVAAGATGTASVLVALVPAALNPMLVHVSYRFEYNVRASTILGLVGAGGIGQAIFNAQQLLFFGQLSSYVICVVVFVLAIDAASAKLRERLQLQRLTA